MLKSQIRLQDHAWNTWKAAAAFRFRGAVFATADNLELVLEECIMI